MDLFNLIHKESGGRLSVEGLDIYHKNYYKNCELTPSHWIEFATMKLEKVYPNGVPEKRKFPKIESGIVNSIGVNCSALLVDGNYYVGIGGLIPVCAMELVSFFINRTDFMVDVGNVDDNSLIMLDGFETLPFFQLAENRYFPLALESLSEADHRSLVEAMCLIRGNTARYDYQTGRYLTADVYLAKIDSVLECLMPRCQVRRAHIEYFSDLIVTFFWAHEISHVTNGHLLTLQELRKTNEIEMFEFSEFGYEGSRNLKILQSSVNDLELTMECDADSTALTFVIGIILEDLEEGDVATNLSQIDRLKYFLFFLYTIFSAIEVHTYRYSDYISSSHPPSSVRLQQLIGALYTMQEHENETITSAIDGLRELLSYFGEYLDTAFISIGFSASEERDLELHKALFQDKYRDVIEKNYNVYPHIEMVAEDTLVELGVMYEFPRSKD